jgi:hypothetical protein
VTWLAVLDDLHHLAVVGIELDPSLAGHPDGPDAGKPEFPPDIIAGEGQQRFVCWLTGSARSL